MFCAAVFYRYLDALGAAAASGVDVFCKETLVGDWLETIRSWQGAQGALQYARKLRWIHEPLD